MVLILLLLTFTSELSQVKPAPTSWDLQPEIEQKIIGTDSSDSYKLVPYIIPNSVTIKLNEKIVWLRQIVSEDGIVLRIENAGVLK